MGSTETIKQSTESTETVNLEESKPVPGKVITSPIYDTSLYAKVPLSKGIWTVIIPIIPYPYLLNKKLYSPATRFSGTVKLISVSETIVVSWTPPSTSKSIVEPENPYPSKVFSSPFFQVNVDPISVKVPN